MKTLEEIRAERKRMKRDKLIEYAVVGVVGAVGVFAIFCLAALVFMGLVWNLGAVGLSEAVGAPVGGIGFWTAFGAVFLVGSLRNIINGRVPIDRKKDKE